MKIKDCNVCVFRKGKNNKIKGVKIPEGTGKCTRPDGHCDPDVVCGGIGQGAVFRRTPLTFRKLADNLRETANFTDDPARYREEHRAADELEITADEMEKVYQYAWIKTNCKVRQRFCIA